MKKLVSLFLAGILAMSYMGTVVFAEDSLYNEQEDERTEIFVDETFFDEHGQPLTEEDVDCNIENVTRSSMLYISL